MYTIVYAMKMKKAQRINCERWDNSFKLKVTTIPTMICKIRNSCGNGAMNEQIRIVTKCVNRAVRESKKVRITIGTMAYGKI